MPHSDLAQSAAVLGAVAAFPVLLGRSRAAVLLGLGLLALAGAGLAVALIPEHDLRRLVESPSHLGGVVALAVAICLLAVALAGRLGWAPVLLLAAAPFRIPVTLGSQHANLLLPLYGVLAATLLAFVWTVATDSELRPVPRALALPSAALVGLYGLSLLWAEDKHAGSIELLFFLFPFVALVTAVARGPSPAWLPRALAATVVGEAVLFAAVGLWQEESHHLFFSRSLEVANIYTTYFRTNSLFTDPNIYARHLVFALAVLLVLLWRRRIDVFVAAALGAVLWAALYYSYSQSGLATLFLVAILVTLVAADRRARQVIAIAAATFVLVGTGLVAANVKGQSLSRSTSGRSKLVSVAFDVFREHPLAGVGVGSQPFASHKQTRFGTTARRNASHTTPLTVAAELGIVGFLVYVGWLAGAALTLRAAWRLDATMGIALATVFGVLLVHSLFYSGFFEDPITWGVLATAAAFTTARARLSRSAA